METNLLFSHNLCLPNIYLVESSEQAFADAFLQASQILSKYLEQIKLHIQAIKDFDTDPFNVAILGLFCKIYRHYYSYVLLEINSEHIGSQFLIENLCEAAITLAYLLEEADDSLFSEYISASVGQAFNLLNEVEEQLQKFPNEPDLLVLRKQLKTFTSKESSSQSPLAASVATHLWGSHKENTTAKRGTIIGLNFLTSPARQIALKVTPASWLDLYLSSFVKSSPQAKPSINFKHLRDVSHLCLHATQTLLEEVATYHANLLNTESQQQNLNSLYEWFHTAHKVYQQQCLTQK